MCKTTWLFIAISFLGTSFALAQSTADVKTPVQGVQSNTISPAAAAALRQPTNKQLMEALKQMSGRLYSLNAIIAKQQQTLAQERQTITQIKRVSIQNATKLRDVQGRLAIVCKNVMNEVGASPPKDLAMCTARFYNSSALPKLVAPFY